MPRWRHWKRENCSGLWFQSIFVGLTMNILSISIMLVIYGRMIEGVPDQPGWTNSSLPP